MSEAVIVAFITVAGTICTSLITKAYSDNTKAMEALIKRVDNVEHLAKGSNNGNLALTRFRLIREMKRALQRGWESFDNFEEVCALYEGYRARGGNGNVKVLFENEYINLPKRDENILKT